MPDDRIYLAQKPVSTVARLLTQKDANLLFPYISMLCNISFKVKKDVAKEWNISEQCSKIRHGLLLKNNFMQKQCKKWLIHSLWEIDNVHENITIICIIFHATYLVLRFLDNNSYIKEFYCFIECLVWCIYLCFWHFQTVTVCNLQ